MLPVPAGDVLKGYELKEELSWRDPVCLNCKTIHTNLSIQSSFEITKTINHLPVLWDIGLRLLWDVFNQETGSCFPTLGAAGL